MGFKIIGKKDGKRTVSDNPDNEDTKVTSAVKFLLEADPGAVSKGTTIRFLWDPKTGDTFCWIQGDVSEASNSNKKAKKDKVESNKVTVKNLVLVECWGEEYTKKLPKTMTIELNRQQTWALGTEATLDTEEENEAVQIDMNSIPTVIKLGDSDAEEALEEKGAAGGIPTLELKNSNVTQKPTESTENSSTDDSSGDESANSIDEAGKARIQRNKYINEWLTDKTIDDILHRVQLAAQANKGRTNGVAMTVGEACHNAQRGMDQAFIAGALTTSAGVVRSDSTEYSRQVTQKVKIEAAVKAKT